MGKRQKHVFFIMRAKGGRGNLPAEIESFSFAKPALSDPDRTVKLLDACRTRHPDERFELFTIGTDAMPGVKPFGDALSDEAILESFDD